MKRERHNSLIWPGYLSWPCLISLLVLVVNDHLLKGSGLLPGWLTGKLSDVAGLFFFPLLLVALLHLAGRWWGFSVRRTHTLAAGLLTATVFAAIQLSDVAVAAYAFALELLPVIYWHQAPSITPDPTDLLTLPAVWLAIRWAHRFVPDERNVTFKP